MQRYYLLPIIIVSCKCFNYSEVLHCCTQIRSSLKKTGFHDKLSSLKSQLQSVDKDTGMFIYSKLGVGVKNTGSRCVLVHLLKCWIFVRFVAH